jgi:AcrR family transcriptional regulator
MRSGVADTDERAPRRQRADAQRNVDSLLLAAKQVFADSGVDAPAKQITDLAGVGVGTLYRHFPLRSDLVTAVLAHEVDETVAAGPALAAGNEPGEALTQWLLRYTDFLSTKRGLAAALHSGDPAFDGLLDFFLQRLVPVLSALLESAASAGQIGTGHNAEDLLRAIAHLSNAASGEGSAFSTRMVALLLAGLRSGASERRS